MPPANCLHPHPGPTSPNPNGLKTPLAISRWSRRNLSNCSSQVLPSSSLPQSVVSSRSFTTSSSFYSLDSSRRLFCMQSSKSSSRYAVLGAGFAGLSVAWHLLKNSPKESHICVDIYDEAGIGGGASGSSGGLLHPYSPKGKVLWRGADCWKECLQLLTTAEEAVEARVSNIIAQESFHDIGEPIILRRGILKPATTEKNVEILKESAQNCLESCNLEALDGGAAQFLVPGLLMPFHSALYMPLAMNIHPKRYLQALFLACQNLTDIVSNVDSEEREINLCKKHIRSLHELGGDYDAVIVCIGAEATKLPELIGKLPLRTCRGVIVHLQLPSESKGEYHDESPSILSDAWLAFQGPRNVLVGSTWDWGSTNYSSAVSMEEASVALHQLMPKASAVYPDLRNWGFIGARAGLRAMPPLTPLGSLPLMGCLDEAFTERSGCRYWLVGGLGSRGLLYHGLMGKLMAQAVISSDEKVLPSELVQWKKTALWRALC